MNDKICKFRISRIQGLFGKTVMKLVVLTVITIATTFISPPQTRVFSQSDIGWKVWVKTSPCSGRFDWVSVAKENPTYGAGGDYFQNADMIITGTGMHCVRNIDQSCTKADATAEAAIVRASSKFSNYCCKDYSIWRNIQTGKMSIVVGKFGTAGYGWEFEDGPMCCEEAESLSGIKGACSGSHEGGGKAGYIGCYKDTSAFDLNGFLQVSQTNTPQACIATCLGKGFAFAGVQYGQSCLCGNSYGKYGKADNCNYKCTGDSGQICGGYTANNIYSTASTGGGTKPPTEVDLSGTWQAIITESNTGSGFTYDLALSRTAKGKWQGAFRLSVPQNPSLGFNSQATVESLGGDNLRITYFAQGRTQIGNGTYTKDRITFGGSQNSVVFTRR